MGSPAHKAAPTRVVQRRRKLIQRRIAMCLLAGMFATAGTSAILLRPAQSAYADATPFDTSIAVTRSTLTDTVSASRSESREPLKNSESTTNGGSWDTSSSDEVTEKLSIISADNTVVKALINGRDEGQTPDGFNPNHADGDTGNAYEYSQCTWWAYVRRHQLGLPVGSHLGNGADWAASARKLGYWVDNTPRQGDVICFQRGQYESDSTYGHVAIVEEVKSDGSIVTSECGSVCNGKPYTRTFTAKQAAQLQFIHY